MATSDFYIMQVGRVAVLPVLHYSFEFALAVREVFHQLRPAAVAVEYPHAVQDLVVQAVNRLPRMSALSYEPGTPGEDRELIIFEPVDAFVEASRLALAAGIPLRCMDTAVVGYPQQHEFLPDTYALRHIGHRRYCELLLERLAKTKAVPFFSFQAPESYQLAVLDQLRERAMAFHIQDLEAGLAASAGPVLVVCGLSHLTGLCEALAQPQAQPLEGRVRAQLFHLAPGCLSEILSTFPFLSAVYETQRTVAGSLGGVATRDSLEDSQEVALDDSKGEIQAAFAELRLSFQKLLRNEADEPKPENLAEEPEPVPPRKKFQVVQGSKNESVEEVVRRAVAQTAQEGDGSDRYDLLCRYLLWVKTHYETQTGETISNHQLRLIDRFARKYAAVEGLLLPGYYELLVAGRGCVSSHFCYRMWEIGSAYRWQEGPSDLPVIELTLEDLHRSSRRIRMNPQPPLRPRPKSLQFLKKRDKAKKEKLPQPPTNPFAVCSFPPEDLIIENYGNFLRTKGRLMVSEERKRIQPFETSLLDGIDLRETIRNWHTGKIYVQECQTVKGGVDSIVVIFDEDDAKYTYTMTWLGEHTQESDMAFYATEPDEHTVGPGIKRAVYGGFLMTMPPGRLWNVFQDAAYAFAETYAERLLLAGIDYSEDRFVLYAAPNPPRPIMRQIAGRYGKRIIYVPLSQLSPVMLQRIRTMHILAGHRVRDYAKDYIW
ncbi:MAG: hypothetical protein K1Y36_21480 [Blastocatellia bacterium]|nr:hypothetical protein [Blastocatellia bacterium]